MITENLSTLKIHKLTQEQYDRAAAAGNIETNALYLTPAKEIVGGSLEPLIVTAISDTEVDKSVDEIHAAVESGREVFLSVNGGMMALTAFIESSIDEPASAIFSMNWGNFFGTWMVIGKSYYALSFESVNKENIPTKVSQLVNDLKYIESSALETLLEPFPVFVDTDTNTVTSTVDEILMAYYQSKNIFLVVDNNAVPFTSFSENPAIVLFERVVDDGIERFLVVADTVHKQKISIPTDEHINGLIEEKLEGFDAPSGGGSGGSGIDGYTLIKHITLENDVSIVTISTDDSGNVLNITEAILTMENNASTSNSDCYMRLNNRPQRMIARLANTQTTSAIIRFSRVGGKVLVESCSGQTAHFEGAPRMFATLVDVGKITSITLATSGQSWLMAGTEFKLYARG